MTCFWIFRKWFWKIWKNMSSGEADCGFYYVLKTATVKSTKPNQGPDCLILSSYFLLAKKQYSINLFYNLYLAEVFIDGSDWYKLT